RTLLNEAAGIFPAFGRQQWGIQLQRLPPRSVRCLRRRRPCLTDQTEAQRDQAGEAQQTHSLRSRRLWPIQNTITAATVSVGIHNSWKPKFNCQTISSGRNTSAANCSRNPIVLRIGCANWATNASRWNLSLNSQEFGICRASLWGGVPANSEDVIEIVSGESTRRPAAPAASARRGLL